AARIEFVVAAGSGGGAGSLYISRLELRERAVPPATWPTPVATRGVDPATGGETIVLDFGQRREFGGLIVRWDGRAFASRYDVQLSDDAIDWRTVRTVADANGGPDALLLPDAEARYVRLVLHDGPLRRYALRDIEVRDLAFGASPNAFFESIARESPRGF